jgi:hypothetical protein
MTRPFRRIGTASCDIMLRSGPTKRGSLPMSLTRIGRPCSTAAPTTPCPDLQRSVRHDVLRIPDGVRDCAVPAAPRRAGKPRTALNRVRPRDQLRDLLEKVRQVEHRRDLATELEQRDSSSVSVAGERGVAAGLDELAHVLL